MLELLGISTLFLGVFFLTAGTVGLIRFPTAISKLHALTKADNLGFGFLVLSGIFYHKDFFTTLKLILIWFLVIISSSTFSYIFANAMYKKDRGKMK